MELILSLLLAVAEPIRTVACREIADCEKQAIVMCGGANKYKSVVLRGPYPDGLFQLDFVCLKAV